MNQKMDRVISKKSSFFSVFLQRWWWTLLFALLCYGIYATGMEKKKKIFYQLEDKIKNLEQARASALLKREELEMEIESQMDPAWIEMLLMKKLGVVPEGQVKVYFEKE